MRIPLINEMIEDEQITADGDATPFPNVSEEYFKMIVEYTQILDSCPEPKIEYPLKDYWFFRLVHKDF